MSSTAEQLTSLKPGKFRRVRGQDIKREGDRYTIDGEEYSLDDAVKKVEKDAAPRTGFDYKWTVFLECLPSFPAIPIKHYCCNNKTDYTALIEAIKKRKNYLYYGTVSKDGNRYFSNPPYIIEWDTVPEHPDDIKKVAEAKAKPRDPSKWDGGLSCPFCGLEVSSTPGRTLHVKAHHNERLTEYHSLLDGGTPKVEIEDDDDDVISRQTEAAVGYSCPFCKVRPASTSGRTLHVQGKHPERLQEYQKLLVGGEL